MGEYKKGVVEGEGGGVEREKPQNRGKHGRKRLQEGGSYNCMI